MYEQQLSQAGLTQGQATVYEALLKTGPITASKISQKTPFKRGLVYKLLDELVVLGLVNKKEEPGTVAIFAPAHPDKLKDLMATLAEKAKVSQSMLDNVLGALISDFNLISGKPGIRFYEGEKGIKQIYDDILQVSEDFLLIRSVYEPTYQEKILPIVEDFIKKRVAKNIKAIALTPTDTYPTLEERKKRGQGDQARLIERVWVDAKLYNAPVEIDIYGNRVAIISFAKELVGIIIDSPQIAQALKQIFALAKTGAKTVSQSLG